MAQCDLCGGKCELHDMTTLLDSYQVDGIKDICRDCERWATGLKLDLQSEIAPKLRAAIRERANRPAPTAVESTWGRFCRAVGAAFSV